jgi:hypothetical protein
MGRGPLTDMLYTDTRSSMSHIDTILLVSLQSLPYVMPLMPCIGLLKAVNTLNPVSYETTRIP